MRKRLVDLLLSTKKSNRITKNVYKTTYHKNLLISYNVNHFLIKNTAHTNYYESHIISKFFSELGYNIDVVSFDNPRNFDLTHYDVIFGFGLPLEKSFAINKSIKRIYYATGAHVCYQNSAEIQRIQAVNREKNTFLKPKRIIEWTWSQSSSMSDALVIIGNEWTQSTYQPYTDSPIYTLNATSLFYNSSIILNRDISVTKQHFLWFGSGGLIHKGLDLCLEFFSKNPHLHLHICGPKEDDFYKVFHDKLHLNNIHIHGFVQVDSDDFLQIVQQCLFTIMPSCSEGQSTSLLTTMATGLIPIASKESGKTLNNLGISIETLSLEGIEHSINAAAMLNDTELAALTHANRKEIFLNHTLETFEKQIRHIFSSIEL